MKVKALRYKKEHNPSQEFVSIENFGDEPMVFTSSLPRVLPKTATLEGLKNLLEENDMLEGLDLDWETLELIEFNLIESGEVGADIRNKLTPCYNLLAVLKIYFKEKDDSKKYYMKKLIEKEMELSKKSIKYIANLL